ncbi:MAG: hypothetical protein ACWGHO_04670 [Candidatus Moraniibacteriota bacterium]
MKINKAITESIINYIHLTFEKENFDVGGFRVLLIASNVSKEDVSDFICKSGINYQRIEEEIASSDDFFFKLSSNILPYLLSEQRIMFQVVMKKFGFILGANKHFRKGKKAELVDYDKEKKIKTIEIYKDEYGSRFRVAVNNIMIKWIKPKIGSEKPYWQYIYEIADKGECYVGDANKANEVVQWFNSKSKKEQKPIYKYTNLMPTNIICVSGDYLLPSKGISISIMKDKKAYKRKS